MITRVKSTVFFDLVKPFLQGWVEFSEDEEEGKELYKQWLVEVFNNRREDCFVLCSVNTTGAIDAFIITVKTNTRFAFVLEAWNSLNEPDKTLSKRLLDQTVQWTKGKGCDALRMETRRSAEAFSRAWGFEQIATINELKFVKQVEETNGSDK